MTQSDETLSIETDAEAADIVCTNFGSRELRKLASNAGVSRERGDTMRATAEKIVAQDPALAARIIENDNEVDMFADRFKERREVGGDAISLAEAMRRARTDKMHSKLEGLSRAIPVQYSAEVQWEYGSDVLSERGIIDRGVGHKPGLTSVRVRPSDAFETHWALEGSAHILLTPQGRCTMMEVDDSEYINRNTSDPTKAWRRGLRRIERFWAGGGDDE